VNRYLCIITKLAHALDITEVILAPSPQEALALAKASVAGGATYRFAVYTLRGDTGILKQTDTLLHKETL